MSYQSTRTDGPDENAAKRWLLIAASLLAIAACLILEIRTPAARPAATEAPASLASAGPDPSPDESGRLASRDIDPATLSDGRALPPPSIRFDAEEPVTPEPAPAPVTLPPDAFATREEAEATLAGLGIAAVADTKIIIRGRLLQTGDFIDADHRLKFIGRLGGKLVLEIDGRRYTSLARY